MVKLVIPVIPSTRAISSVSVPSTTALSAILTLPVVLDLRRSRSVALTVESDTDNVKLFVVSAIASKLTMLSERVADIEALVLDSSAVISATVAGLVNVTASLPSNPVISVAPALKAARTSVAEPVIEVAAVSLITPSVLLLSLAKAAASTCVSFALNVIL